MKSLLHFGIVFLLFHSCLASEIPYHKAISDLKDSIVKGFGFTSEDEVKITGFDPREAEVGHSVEYRFDLEIDHQVIPFKLLEDVKRWDYVDLPIFRAQDQVHTGLVPKRASANDLPVLAPFVLAGPMELWIHDANDMRLSLPHDVDAGVLKKVILAEGAAVTVKGARSVSLRQPLDFPLPLNRTENGFANGLLTLAQHIRHASRTQASSIMSLRIVGPTSIAAAPSDTTTSTSLKLKRLAPGLVELSSPLRTKDIESFSSVDLEGEAPTILSPSQFSTLWPLSSLNGSNANLLGFEKLLHSVLGDKANKKGSFRLVKAVVSAQTYVKIGFKAEKKVKEGELEGYPAWRTKPETVTTQFEVLAKVDGEEVVPEKVIPVKPVVKLDNVAPNLLTGNVSMSKTQDVHPPPNPFFL
ncbi:unnamed protein product [Sphenostylis stenocarpa]|uniref:Tunicamycin induced 1 n=1 Tax=Sphenostylis stenocarpa TaxID=92480 RepID=A0AA86SIT6_9FABA|nr:unnamed protein product [Sphenostylis stenocarpa]